MAASSLRQATTTDSLGQGAPSGSEADAAPSFIKPPIRASTQANCSQTSRIPASKTVAIGIHTQCFYRRAPAPGAALEDVPAARNEQRKNRSACRSHPPNSRWGRWYDLSLIHI